MSGRSGTIEIVLTGSRALSAAMNRRSLAVLVLVADRGPSRARVDHGGGAGVVIRGARRHGGALAVRGGRGGGRGRAVRGRPRVLSALVRAERPPRAALQHRAGARSSPTRRRRGGGLRAVHRRSAGRGAARGDHGAARDPARVDRASRGERGGPGCDARRRARDRGDGRARGTCRARRRRSARARSGAVGAARDRRRRRDPRRS